MKIAFFGLPLAALLLLEDGHDLVLAVLSPHAAPGGYRLRRRLDAARLIDARDDAAYSEVGARLVEAVPDLIVSWFWPRKIPEAWLGYARLGGIGSHPSLLPRHRGPNPYYWAIDSGDEVTGVTVHRLEGEYDTGVRLAQARVAIGTLNSWQLARALDRPSLSLLRRVARELASGNRLTEAPQDHSAATLAPEPGEAEMKVDWSWTSERILRRIRALSPVPGLPIEIRGLNFFVLDAHAVTTPKSGALLPGEAALRRGPPVTVVICTVDGAIAIDRVVVDDGDDEPELSEGREFNGEELADALMRRSPEMVSCFL